MGTNTSITIDAKKVRSCLGYISVVVAVLAVFMIFAPAINMSGFDFADGSAFTYSGIEVCFGEYYDGGYYTKPSAYMTVYIALIIGIVFAVLANDKKRGKVIMYVIAIVAFAYAAVGFMLTTDLPIYGDKHYDLFYNNDSSYQAVLGGGAITGIIASIIATLSQVIALIISKKYYLI